MAAAVLATRGKTIRPGSSRQENNIELIPMPLLPDKKEWIAEHDIEMLMLDGYDIKSIALFFVSFDKCMVSCKLCVQDMAPSKNRLDKG